MRRRPRAIVSFNMSRIRGRDTKPEVALRRALHALGLRYRLHAQLPGRPDILFVSARLAVFVDGAFWHGRDLRGLATQLHVRRKFWLEKIRENVRRDGRNDAALQARGFRVMRFWDDAVLDGPDRCAREVRATIQARIKDHSVRPRKHRLARASRAAP